MAKQSAEVISLQEPIGNKFIEAQDMLCEATYVAEFLRGTITNAAALESGFELSAPEAYGFANVIQNLIERIEKAHALLEEYKESGQ